MVPNGALRYGRGLGLYASCDGEMWGGGWGQCATYPGRVMRWRDRMAIGRGANRAAPHGQRRGEKSVWLWAREADPPPASFQEPRKGLWLMPGRHPRPHVPRKFCGIFGLRG